MATTITIIAKLVFVLLSFGLTFAANDETERLVNDKQVPEAKTKEPGHRTELLQIDGPLLKRIGIGAQTKIKVDRRGNKWYLDENNGEWVHLPAEVDPIPASAANPHSYNEEYPNVFQALNHMKRQPKPNRGPTGYRPTNLLNNDNEGSDYENGDSERPEEPKHVYRPLPHSSDDFGLPDEEIDSDDSIVTWEQLNQAAINFPNQIGPGFPHQIYPEKPVREKPTKKTTPFDDEREPNYETSRRPPRRSRRPTRTTKTPEYGEYDDSEGLIPPYIPPVNSDYQGLGPFPNEVRPDYDDRTTQGHAVRQPPTKANVRPGHHIHRRPGPPFWPMASDPWSIFTQTPAASPSIPDLVINTVLQTVATESSTATETESTTTTSTTTTSPYPTTIQTTTTMNPMDNMSPIMPDIPDLINQILPQNGTNSNKPFEPSIIAVINQIVSNALNAANKTSLIPSLPPIETPGQVEGIPGQNSPAENPSSPKPDQYTSGMTSSQMFVKLPTTTVDPWQVITLGRRRTPVPIVEYPTMGALAEEVWKPVMGPYTPVLVSPVFPNHHSNEWIKPNDVADDEERTTRAIVKSTKKPNKRIVTTTKKKSSKASKRPKVTITSPEITSTIATTFNPQSNKREKTKRPRKPKTTTMTTTEEDYEYEDELPELMPSLTSTHKSETSTKSPKTTIIKGNNDGSELEPEDEYEYEEEITDPSTTTSTTLQTTIVGETSPTIPDINVVDDLDEISNSGISIGADDEKGDEEEGEDDNDLDTTTTEEEYEDEESDTTESLNGSEGTSNSLNDSENDNSEGVEYSDDDESEDESSTQTITSKPTDSWSHIVVPIRKKDPIVPFKSLSKN